MYEADDPITADFDLQMNCQDFVKNYYALIYISSGLKPEKNLKNDICNICLFWIRSYNVKASPNPQW